MKYDAADIKKIYMLDINRSKVKQEYNVFVHMHPLRWMM